MARATAIPGNYLIKRNHSINLGKKRELSENKKYKLLKEWEERNVILHRWSNVTSINNLVTLTSNFTNLMEDIYNQQKHWTGTLKNEFADRIGTAKSALINGFRTYFINSFIKEYETAGRSRGHIKQFKGDMKVINSAIGKKRKWLFPVEVIDFIRRMDQKIFP